MAISKKTPQLLSWSSLYIFRMHEKFVSRLPHLKETASIWGSISFGVATTVLTFFPKIGLFGKDINNCIVLFVTCAVFVVGALCQTMFGKKNTIWEKGNNKITAIYGNILDEASEHEEIRVIPVNTAFDTIVDAPCSTDKPLVSPNSLHGQWIKRQKCEQEILRDEILKNISESSYHEVNPSQKKRGNRREYTIGTYSVIRRKNITYLLVALSAFDINNVAHSTQTDLETVLQSVVSYHNQCGQGAKLMIPLMGTANSRMKLDYQESFDIIKNYLLLRKKDINGCIEIVVYQKDASKVSIWN